MRIACLILAMAASAAHAAPAAAEAAKGTVLRTNAASRRVDLRDQAGNTLSLILKADAQILFRDRPMPLADLRPGDRVEAVFEKVAGQLLVSKLTVTQRAVHAVDDSPVPLGTPKEG